MTATAQPALRCHRHFPGGSHGDTSFPPMILDRPRKAEEYVRRPSCSVQATATPRDMGSCIRYARPGGACRYKLTDLQHQSFPYSCWQSSVHDCPSHSLISGLSASTIAICHSCYKPHAQPARKHELCKHQRNIDVGLVSIVFIRFLQPFPLHLACTTWRA